MVTYEVSWMEEWFDRYMGWSDDIDKKAEFSSEDQAKAFMRQLKDDKKNYHIRGLKKEWTYKVSVFDDV